MDRFTRIYSILLGIVILAGLMFSLRSSYHPRVSELNSLLESDSFLAAYPYHFEVKSLDQGVVTLSSPRSPEFPAIRFLELIHPELHGKAQDDPKMVAAQQELIDHQKRAMGMMLAQSDIKSVNWTLDRVWLANHGVQVAVDGMRP